MQDEIVREMAWERRMMGLGQRALGSYFECDTEVCGKYASSTRSARWCRSRRCRPSRTTSSRY